jgi:hypothetical protein
MKIQQTNSSLDFKSTYPVVHRVITAKGTYVPVSDFEVVKKLQSKLVRALNSSWEKMFLSLDKEARQNVSLWTQSSSLDAVKSELKLPGTEKEALAIFRGRFGFYDLDYAYAPKPQKNPKQKGNVNSEQRVRSFYNKEKSLIDGRYYLAYMISGKDIKPFEDDLAKNIGKTKHEAISATENAYSQEAKDAIDLYNKNGLEFVNDSQYRLKSKKDGMTYILRANFQPVLNKFGKIKDYKFISAKFVPEYTK